MIEKKELKNNDSCLNNDTLLDFMQPVKLKQQPVNKVFKLLF